MRICLRKVGAAILATALLAVLGSSPALAVDPIYTGTFSSLALKGHDPVAYFTEGRPALGSKQFEHEWNGATWRFASARHRDLFRADPERYAPQYGGYCAYAVAHGGTAPGDPEVWKIVDDKLYLNVNRDIAQEWAKDIPGFIATADAKWPGILAGS